MQLRKEAEATAKANCYLLAASSRCPRLAGPVAQQFNFSAGIADFPRRMKVDAVVATEVWTDQAPSIKATAGDGDQNGFSRRFGQMAPAVTLQLDRRARGVIRKNIIHGDDGAGVFLMRYVHHLRIDFVALFFSLKLDVEDKVFVGRDHNGRRVEVAVALERVLGFMKKFI